MPKPNNTHRHTGSGQAGDRFLVIKAYTQTDLANYHGLKYDCFSERHLSCYSATILHIRETVTTETRLEGNCDDSSISLLDVNVGLGF